MNDSDFGLVASVMTRDRARFEHCIRRVRTGVLNWNRGTIGASGRLPFGGTRRSGNDRPAGILSTLYCTAPQARLEHAGGFDPATPPARHAAPVTPRRDARWVLMGDPAHFSVKGGANPHTRTRWGTKRSVDRALAVAQWRRLHDLLRELGVRVLVVPPDPQQPGLVYPANAGFMLDVDAELPLAERRFVLANLLPTRAGEREHYRRVLEAAGIHTESFDERFRMEGEADFFPAGDVHLLTHGSLERQRFVPALAFPPWKRVYGFRTDVRAEPLLAALVAPRRVVPLELTLEAHYHGDTVLCAFGPGRRLLLAYRAGLVARELGAPAQPLRQRRDRALATPTPRATPRTPSASCAAARPCW